MRTKRLGRTGLYVSEICLGTMTYGGKGFWEVIGKLGLDAVKGQLKLAIDAGVNFVDTADVYHEGESERLVAEAIAGLGIARHSLVLATKVRGRVGKGPNDVGLSRKHIFDAIDASLRRLQTDYIDLWQIHRWDAATPIEETLQALHDVVRAGKVRYLGASSMNAWRFAKAQQVAERNGWTQFVSMQNHWNLMYREEEREMVPLCLDQGVGCIPWSPLARGRLARGPTGGETLRSGKDRFGQMVYGTMPDADRRVLEALDVVAKARALPHAQVALAWLLQKDGVTAPIVGATKMDHLDTAVAAVDVKLTPEEIAALEAPYVPHPVVGF